METSKRTFNQDGDKMSRPNGDANIKINKIHVTFYKWKNKAGDAGRLFTAMEILQGT